MSKTRSATLAGLVAILLWSSLALLTVLTSDLPPFEVLAITFALGALSSRLVAGRATASSGRVSLRVLALSVSALFGYHALYFISFRHAPAIEVNLINYLWPLLIVVFAAFAPDTRPSARQMLGCLLGLVGVVIMLGRGELPSFGALTWNGHACAFAAALTWAAYSVLNRRIGGGADARIDRACLLVALLAAGVHLGFESSVMPSVAQAVTLLVMGLGPVGIAFGLWDRGTREGDLGVLGTLSYAAPVLSTLLLLASGRVDPHWSQALAVVMLLVGAGLSIEARKR